MQGKQLWEVMVVVFAIYRTSTNSNSIIDSGDAKSAPIGWCEGDAMRAGHELHSIYLLLL